MSSWVHFLLPLVVAIYISSQAQVTNGFSTNDNPLVIHCKSKGDDLGEHTLLEFHFRVTLVGFTHFWCLKGKKIIIFVLTVGNATGDLLMTEAV